MPEYAGKRSSTQDLGHNALNLHAGTPGKQTRVEQAYAADVQRRANTIEAAETSAIHAAAAQGVATSSSPLPHAYTIQCAFGRHDISAVQAHTGSEAAASAGAMGAEAYATGDHVVLGRGTDLHTVAHEAAHVIQQRAGVHLSGGVGRPGDPYEQHADAVGDKVVRGESADTLLDTMAHRDASGGSAVQGRAIQRAEGPATATSTAAAAPAPDAQPTRRATTIHNIVLHQGPGKDTPRVSVQPDWVGPGTSFDVLATSGSWLQVSYNGVTAYITAGSKYVKIEDLPAAPAPATPAPASASPATAGVVDTLASAAASRLDMIGEAIASVPGAISAGVSSLIGRFTTAQPTPSEQPQLDRDAQDPANQTPAPGQATPAFGNQRDNTFVGEAGGEAVTGGNECNITTLGMQLRTVAQDDARVRAACCANLERLGGAASDDDRTSAQIEDLLLRRFFLAEWANGNEWRKLESQKPFWKGFADLVKGRKYHQNSLCINHVASELTSALPIGALGHDEAKDDADQARLLNPEYFKTTFVPVLSGGGSVMLSTELTGGHIVLLTAVLADGITINDPYGMCLEKVEKARGYLRNGDALSWGLKVKATYAGNVPTRSKMNDGPIANVVEGGPEKMPDNLGERNFYTWAEVETYKIGKWNNTMEKEK